MSIRKRRQKTRFFFFLFLICLEFRKMYTIGMLNAGMTINAVAINTGYSTRAIRHLRQTFSSNRAYGRSTTYWTSACHDTWPRPLYSEHPPAHSLPNCHN